MKSSVCVCLFLTLLIAVTLAKPADKSSRVKDEVKLSDEGHFDGDEHNPDYDHDAFLGQQEAKTFDNLSPEESRKRLGKIVEKIDKDHDGFVTETELKDWIVHQQMRYIDEDVRERWQQNDQNKDSNLSWDEYLTRTYGAVEEELLKIKESERMDFSMMIRRDKKRWAAADLDKDEEMTYEEFVAFLHPEEKSHMRQIVIEETMEDIDKDGDGFVDLEEYIGDMWPKSEREKDAEEPEWVVTEREQFIAFRDRDGDGKMDKEEIGAWILPEDYDHAEAEAKHLVFESDTDKDNRLTKEEIVAKYDLFVGSQATDFGEALARHDEF